MGVSLNTEPCPLRQIWGAGLLQSDHTPDPAQTASLVHHVYNLAARMRSPDLRWTMGRMTLKCNYTFSKMEKLVKGLILQ